MSPNRVRLLAVLGCAAGAGLVLLAAGRTWAHVTVVRPAPLPPLHQARTGAALLPWLSPLALASLAGAGALLATRGLVRAVVGVLLVASGLGAVAGAVARLATGAAPGWPAVVVLGGLLVAAAGAVTVARGRSWPGMGARYDRPAPKPGGSGTPGAEAQTPGTEAQLWDALDRGEDPTR